MKRLIRGLMLGVLLCVASLSQAQQNTIFRIKAEGQYGWLFGNASGVSVYGGEASMELPLFGNHNWEYTYNFPTVGFSVGYLRMPDPNYDRHTIPVMTYFHWPMVHTKMFSLNLKWGSASPFFRHFTISATGVFIGVLSKK